MYHLKFLSESFEKKKTDKIQQCIWNCGYFTKEDIFFVFYFYFIK